MVMEPGTLAIEDSLSGPGRCPPSENSRAVRLMIVGTGTAALSVTVPTLDTPADTVTGVRTRLLRIPATTFVLTVSTAEAEPPGKLAEMVACAGAKAVSIFGVDIENAADGSLRG